MLLDVTRQEICCIWQHSQITARVASQVGNQIKRFRLQKSDVSHLQCRFKLRGSERLSKRLHHFIFTPSPLGSHRCGHSLHGGSILALRALIPYVTPKEYVSNPENSAT